MDKRTDMQKWVWENIGPPLYYCSVCLLAVQVTPVEGQEPVIKRDCDCNAQIIAPRKSILAGEGGLSVGDSIKSFWWKLAAALTGKCV